MELEKKAPRFAIGSLIALVVLASAARAATHAQGAILSSSLSPLEQRLFDQIHDGRFGHFSLLEAGLIAGGIDRADDLQSYSRQFDALVETLRRSGKVRGTPHAQAQTIFEFLHRTLLHGGYDLQSSDLRQAFDRGRFNCVTASLLLNCLARRFGLQAVGLELPGHAMTRLELPGETLDVETTCPRWFRLDRSRAAPPQRPPRQVTDVELVATIYYNRGVDLLAEKRFAEAAAANAKAVRLDPENATAKGNFLATINNWAIECGTSGDYEKAARLFRIGMAADPSYATFHANYVQLYRQWSAKLCREGRYDDALRLLDRAAREQPGEKFFSAAAIEIIRRLAR